MVLSCLNKSDSLASFSVGNDSDAIECVEDVIGDEAVVVASLTTALLIHSIVNLTFTFIYWTMGMSKYYSG